MRQVNFSLIFVFGLVMVFFTLQNTAPTTVHVFPGLSRTLPLAALLLVVAGIGAFIAWLFAAWSGMLKNVETLTEVSTLEAQKVRIQELESDLNRYRSTVETQLGLLPSASSANEQDDADEEESNVDPNNESDNDSQTINVDAES